ncbi:hypothetical protein NMG60_11007756 [Bertholletia excelsa]
METRADNDVKADEQLIGTNDESGESLAKENGLHVVNPSTSDNQDQLLEMVVELNFQNEYLKSKLEDLKILHSESCGSNKLQGTTEQASGETEDAKELQKKIESLSRELLEEKQTRGAAEEAMKHLQEVYSEADKKAQELSTKLAEAEQKMDQEIKERDEKYSELDSKFNRLHKRAKQRIQEVQKSALQQELERTRQQANEALKAMDLDRQQLRSANNKLRDNIEELRRSLEPKENALEALQQSLLEKEQMLEDVRGLLQTAEDKKKAAIAEVTAKHQSLEAQLADALADRNKATETISSLQGVIAEKESKIADMDAASSGEAARLKAAMETVKGELIHIKNEHDKERASWQAENQALKTKLEVAESNCIRAEIEAAKMRSQLELELSLQAELQSTKDAELSLQKKRYWILSLAINHLENEFSSYKRRAHTLLQKKDAELVAARDNEQLKAQEEALKEAEKEVHSVAAERDRALQDLQDALVNHNKELAARDAAFSTAEQQIKSMEMKLSVTLANYLADKEAWDVNLRNLEETWRLRYEALKANKEESPSPDLLKEIEDLKLRYKKLKEEHGSFRDLADKMMEEKDKEISRLVEDNKKLHKSLELRPLADQNDDHGTGMRVIIEKFYVNKIHFVRIAVTFQKQDAPYSSTSAAEQQILLLARQQAQREEELAQSQRHILALQEEIEELEHENRLHSQQEAMLKEELRNMERSKKREGVDMTYLKNVILKLLETGLLPVVGMLLQFSPEEMQKCQHSFRNSADVPPSPASDASGSGYSFFPRFSLS